MIKSRGHGLELEVRGEPKNRYPDLTIIRAEHILLLKRRNTIRLNMAPPLLVVEVVSPGDIQRDSPKATFHERDYVAKRIQYQDRAIPEYWLVDPQLETVLVLELVKHEYSEVGTFSGKDPIQSPQFSNLALTPATLFAADK